jgi:hypothetical protein
MRCVASSLKANKDEVSCSASNGINNVNRDQPSIE